MSEDTKEGQGRDMTVFELDASTVLLLDLISDLAPVLGQSDPDFWQEIRDAMQSQIEANRSALGGVKP